MSDSQTPPSRALTVWESAILTRLLSVEFTGRKELAQQRDTARGIVLAEGEPSVGLSVDRSLDWAPVVHRIPVEAEAHDSDGMTIHVLLHVVDGFMSEIEVFREDSRPIVDLPEADKFVVMRGRSADHLREN